MDTTYSFGTMFLVGEEHEVVRVKSPEPINIGPGFHTVVEEYDHMNIRHDFKVGFEVKATTDPAGNHYKWYQLAAHTKTIDRSPAVAAANAQNAANIDYLSMMSGIDLPDDGDNMMEGGSDNE